MLSKLQAKNIWWILTSNFYSRKSTGRGIFIKVVPHNPLVGGSSPSEPNILKGFQGFTVLRK